MKTWRKFIQFAEWLAVATAMFVFYLTVIPMALGIGIWCGIQIAYQEIRTKKE